MGPEWQNRVVTLIDLVDTTAAQTTASASTLMRRFHDVVYQAFAGTALKSVEQAYVWNDSVLVLSYVDDSTDSFIRAIDELQTFKKSIDIVRRSYAIAIKGQPFPPPALTGQQATSRVTVLKASSWAMANCYLVESLLKRYRATWYVDGRIVAKIGNLRRAVRKEKVAMLPTRRERLIHLYRDDPWRGSNARSNQ